MGMGLKSGGIDAPWPSPAALYAPEHGLLEEGFYWVKTKGSDEWEVALCQHSGSGARKMSFRTFGLGDIDSDYLTCDLSEIGQRLLPPQ
jgi:hypothetical protein